MSQPCRPVTEFISSNRYYRSYWTGRGGRGFSLGFTLGIALCVGYFFLV